jgi:hypothetical protein
MTVNKRQFQIKSWNKDGKHRHVLQGKHVVAVQCDKIVIKGAGGITIGIAKEDKPQVQVLQSGHLKQ